MNRDGKQRWAERLLLCVLMVGIVGGASGCNWRNSTQRERHLHVMVWMKSGASSEQLRAARDTVIRVEGASSVRMLTPDEISRCLIDQNGRDRVLPIGGPAMPGVVQVVVPDARVYRTIKRRVSSDPGVDAAVVVKQWRRPMRWCVSEPTSASSDG